MDEKGANIDLVFRNGLKDYEVLPPPEVWEKIHPVLKSQHRPIIILRAAAVITIVLTMSFLAYRYTREVSTGLDNEVMAINEGTVTAEKVPVLARTLPAIVKDKDNIQGTREKITESTQILNNLSDSESSEVPVTYTFQEANVLAVNNSKPLQGPLLASLIPSTGKTFEINEQDLRYLQVDNTMKGTERWSIAAMASPTYYSRFSSGSDELSKQLMASEQPLISYSGGLALSFKVNKRISIQSGVYYSSLGQVIDDISSFGGFKKYDVTKGARNFEVVTSGGIIYTTNADVFLIGTGNTQRVMTVYTNDVFDPGKANLQVINTTLRQNFSYLEFPIVMRYKFIDKVIDFNLIGGLSTNILVNNSAYAVVDGGKYSIGTTEGVNLITISSSLGMGMEYNISDKFALNVEPTVRYYLNPGIGLAGSKIHPYSFGIFSGISYKF